MDCEVPGGINETPVLGLQIVNVREALAISYRYVAGEGDILQNLDKSICCAATLHLYVYVLEFHPIWVQIFSQYNFMNLEALC